MKPEMRKYETVHKHGIHDLKLLFAWSGGWGQGDHQYTNDVNDPHQFMSFNFGDIDQSDQKAIDTEVERRKQANLEYIEDLKELGAYESEYIITIHMAHNPAFDEPTPVKQDKESYRYTVLDFSKNKQ